MAIGDDAAAAGMAVVDGVTTDANTIDTEINRTRDYIAQGKGATDAATAGKVVKRDGNGRAKVATPAAAGDIATKAYVDGGLDGKVDDSQLAPGNSAQPNKIPTYNAASQLTTAEPTLAGHAASKNYVDTHTPPAFNGGTVSGQILLPNAFAAASSYVVAYINGDGRISRGTSSRRFKKYIRNARRAAGTLFGVPLREFQIRGANDGVYHVGLIAEEVADNPATARFVVLDADGRPESYDMIGILLAMVYELNDRVDQLEQRTS